MAGGFLAGADRVVTSFHLPRATLATLPSPKLHTDDTMKGLDNDERDEGDIREEPELRTYDLDDSMHIDVAVLVPGENGEGKDFIPKTMQQMAEDVAKRGKEREEYRLRGVESGPKNNEVMDPGASEPRRVTRTRSGAIKRQTILKATREGKAPRGGRSTSRGEANASSSKARKQRSRPTTDISESEETIETSDGDGGEISFAEDDEYLASPSKNKRPRLERTGNSHATRAKATSTPSAAVTLSKKSS